MSPARLLCAVVNDACGFVRRQKLQDREKRPPELSEPHIRRRQRRRQRDPSVTDSQIKNRRAAISGNSRNCSKCGPESAGVGVWCRLVNISGVEGAPVDRSTHYDRRRHTRTFCPLVERTGGQRIQSGGPWRVDGQLGGSAAGRAHQANHCQTETDRQTATAAVQVPCLNLRLQTTPAPTVLLRWMDAVLRVQQTLV